MKKLYGFLSILIIPSFLIFYSFSSGSPGGKSGSPGDGNATCYDCHNSFNVQEESGWITTNIPVDGYTPGESYTVTATGTHADVVKFGFELTAENFLGSKKGTFIITDAARTKFANANAAITHTAGGTAPSGNSNTWSMDWTAPAEGSGNVFFYAAFNAANGMSGNQGDQIYTSSLQVSEYVPMPALTSVEPDHAPQEWTGTVTINGENTNWTGGVSSIMFKYDMDNTIMFEATNIQVTNDTEVSCDISILPEQMIGEYDVMVDAVVLDKGFTVDVASGLGDDLLAGMVNVYPNPATNYVNINIPSESEIRVFDMLGHELLRNELTNYMERIDISGFDSGIYFVQVVHEGNSATKRFMKN